MTQGERFAWLMINADWSAVVLTLKGATRWNLEKMAREVGCGGDHLRRLSRGDVREPKASTAARLLDLFGQHCPHKVDSVLRMSPSLR